VQVRRAIRYADEFMMLVVENVLHNDIESHSRSKYTKVVAGADIPQKIIFHITDNGEDSSVKKIPPIFR